MIVDLRDLEIEQVSGGLVLTGYRMSDNVGDERNQCIYHAGLDDWTTISAY